MSNPEAKIETGNEKKRQPRALSRASRMFYAGLATVGLTFLSAPGVSTLDVEPAIGQAAQPQPEGARLPAIAPPFYGRATLGATFRSNRLRPRSPLYDEIMAYYHDNHYHPYPAVDFRLPRGRPIRAVAAGVIAMADMETDANPNTYPGRPGRFVELDPTDPRLPNYVFKHLSGSRVQVGQQVEVGQILGRAGDTQSPSVHLHFDAQAVPGPEEFNEFSNRVDYGRIAFWQCGERVEINVNSADRGLDINPQPTRQASLRNC